MLKTPILAAAISVLAVAAAHAIPATYDGMGMIKQWTDNENIRDEMPGFVWGTSDSDGANRIGMYVEFADGTTGGMSFTGVAPHWNTSGGIFPGVTVDTAVGFFAAYVNAGLHFLYNTAPTNSYPQALPWAFQNNPNTPYGSNVEPDYNDGANGSEFRISTTGWDYVTIATYSSTVNANVPLPASGLMLASVLGGVAAWRRRKTS